MIKEALQYLVGLGKANLNEINGEQYSDKPLHKIAHPLVEPLRVRNLSAVVEYLKSKFDYGEVSEERLMVHIESPTSIKIYEELNINGNRNEVVHAIALIPDFRFDNWYDAENFNIKMQSCFVNNEDKEVVLKVVGNIKEDNVQTVGDDGVSQAVTAKIGVAAVAKVQVPNPVKLKPFRTFVEVEQPESEFILRMKSGPHCALFEADGGAWKLEAMNNIKAYLKECLEEEIASGRIVLIA